MLTALLNIRHGSAFVAAAIPAAAFVIEAALNPLPDDGKAAKAPPFQTAPVMVTTLGSGTLSAPASMIVSIGFSLAPIADQIIERDYDPTPIQSMQYTVSAPLKRSG